MLISNYNTNSINQISHPKRVVSLVPSLTETIADVGGQEKLVGVTRFCKYPEDIRQKAVVVGGPKDFDVERILRLKPDVVVAVKEENDKNRILTLSEKLPVVLFDILHLPDALKMILLLGNLLGKGEKARNIVSEINENFRQLPETKPLRPCLYLIWKKPWMAAGRETFINEMLRRAGFENVADGRYPAITEKHFSEAEVILLSSEPYPFREKDRRALQEQFPQKKILSVDGELFSWYGSRMLKAADYFRKLRAENH